MVLHAFERALANVVFIDEFGRLFFLEHDQRLTNGELACLAAAGTHALHHALELAGQILHAWHGVQIQTGQGCRRGDLELDLAFIKLTFAQPLAEFLPRARSIGLGAPTLGRRLIQCAKTACGGQKIDLLHVVLANQLDPHLHQIANDGVDILADIAHLGELGGFDLDEGGLSEPGQSPRNLGLAHAGGADHQDVVRHDLRAQPLLDLLPAPAIAQGDGDGAFGPILANDVPVEFGDDFLGRHLRHAGTVSQGAFHNRIDEK